MRIGLKNAKMHYKTENNKVTEEVEIAKQLYELLMES
jgi:hypothetical protein